MVNEKSGGSIGPVHVSPTDKPHKYRTEVVLDVATVRIGVRCTRCGYGMRSSLAPLDHDQTFTKDEGKSFMAKGHRFAKIMLRNMRNIDCIEYMAISLHES